MPACLSGKFSERRTACYPPAAGDPPLAQFEYKVLYALAPGYRVPLVAPRALKDLMIDAGELESTLNALAEQGWEVASSNTSGGSFLAPGCTTVLLRRGKS